MSERVPALRVPPIVFAHRGAMDRAPENTLPAFELALSQGATGLESDAWMTSDGRVVLDHDGVLGRWPRRQRFADMPRSALPAHVPTLDDLYASCGSAFELSLDVKDPAAFDAIVSAARAAGAVERLWLCHDDLAVLDAWRRADEVVHLVHSTRVSRIGEGVRQGAVTLAEHRVDALNLHRLDWSEVYAALCHRAGVHAFAWDVQKPGVVEQLLDMRVDAIYGDHVDQMVTVVGRDGVTSR
ncbi:glycerophosphoryl diester phosphodiesterase [Haloactinopolyspora alba]|uniref:Glycerophosphoryl diester phosphodiesterase n=2 Tax=Haloactinopolyspora alba TaxID=648780 RepID=A0A2P8DPI0_9ACTN|nr:glycerophosphoryl diester phosphodiesterase [Haloactinopolyspora alba]